MNAASSIRFALSRKTWLTPVVLILGLAVVFPAIYLTSTVNPQGNLHGMHIGLVVEKQAPSVAAADASDKLSEAISAHVDRDKFDLVTLSSKQLKTRMENDSIAAAIVVPANFNASIGSLLPSRTDAPVSMPVVQIRTNAGDGGISSGLVTGNLTPLMTAVQQGFGKSLLPIAEAAGAPISASQKFLLQTPFTISSSAYTALPDNSGLGTSALYYTLVLVLLGFIGASVVNPLVDSALGFAPSEVGPIVARRPYLKLSRIQTLLVKFGIIAAASPLAALLVQVVAAPIIGVPIGDPVMMWLFSSASIAAIGVSALAVFAIFGSGLGSLANTVFFVALSMSSSGGTVPIAATPPFFEWLSTFEPFRAIVEGVRAILYFNGNFAAGLSDGWIRVAIGAAIGLALGLAVTTLYERQRKFVRHPAPAAAAAI